MPFLKLAPIKMEEVHKDPNVFVFHDVLSDDDFEIIKTIAEPEVCKENGTFCFLTFCNFQIFSTRANKT